MINAATYIVRVVLGVLYFMASLGTAAHKAPLPDNPAALEKVTADPGPLNSPAKASLAQQRHMPTPKDSPTALHALSEILQHGNPARRASVNLDDSNFLVSEFYFSSLSDRAPPLP